MPSKSAEAGAALAEAILSVYTQPEAPEIQEETWEAVTHDSITLSMNITRNNGSAITDSGFYVVKNGLPTSEWVQYSFSDYGSYSATAGGYKEMTITGLMPDTSYLCYGYAVNGVGKRLRQKSRSPRQSTTVLMQTVFMCWNLPRRFPISTPVTANSIRRSGTMMNTAWIVRQLSTSRHKAKSIIMIMIWWQMSALCANMRRPAPILR